MRPLQQQLRLYGSMSERAPLSWDWVEAQLVDAGTYWVVARTDGYPHPRPVWGVWHEADLGLSIGSPALLADLVAHQRVTVHLDSGTDVVIVEGVPLPAEPTGPPRLIEAYNRKYDWDYRSEEYGPLTRVRPLKVMAWRTAGPAGRESFRATGCWRMQG